MAHNRDNERAVPVDEATLRNCIERGHDVGMRHKDGSLYSATCHDCRVWWRR